MSEPLGKILDEPIEQYHASEAISKSKLDDFRYRPTYFKAKYIDKVVLEEAEPEHFLVGHSSHVLILEGDKAYSERYAIIPPDAPRKPTAAQWRAKNPGADSKAAMDWWADWAEKTQGKVQLTAEQDALNQTMRRAVMEHPVAAALLSEGESEVTWRADLGQCRVQCRTDWWIDWSIHEANGIVGIDYGQRCAVDLKTCQSLTEWARASFQRNAREHGYHRQHGMYEAVIDEVAGVKPDRFLFIAVEKQWPFEAAVFELGQNEINLGREEIGQDIERLAECLRTGQWPGFPQTIQTVSYPDWFMRKGYDQIQDERMG